MREMHENMKKLITCPKFICQLTIKGEIKKIEDRHMKTKIETKDRLRANLSQNGDSYQTDL